MKKLFLTSIMVLIVLLTFSQNEIKVISWNLESGGNDPEYISDRIGEFEDIDIFGLCEVNSGNAEKYEIAASKGEDTQYKSVLSKTGGNDRMLIVYNTQKFELINTEELDDINIDGTVRAPFYAIFKDLENNIEFIFMVNHLARGDRKNWTKNRRHIQAQKLNEWTKGIEIPIIAVGDYNFDYNISTEEHDKGYDEMIKDDQFIWIRPSKLERTQCNMDYEAAVLDFIFINTLAKKWTYTSNIYVHEDDCDVNEKNSDHRAIYGNFIIN